MSYLEMERNLTSQEREALRKKNRKSFFASLDFESGISSSSGLEDIQAAYRDYADSCVY